MHKAFDEGINLFDAADTYGNGYSEELLAKAFPKQRDEIVIATKVGYDFYHHAGQRKGQREIPQDFSPPFIEYAVEQGLKRLKTDHIDLLQLHNIHSDQVADDAVWTTLEKLQREGKIRYYGAALGPAIGWLYEGIDCVQSRKPAVIQHIYNLLEQFPGNCLHAAAYAPPTEAPPAADELPDFKHGRMARAPQIDTSFLIRVPHSSGMLEGHYTEETVFPPEDHRSHRPRSWLLNGLQKIKTLDFLTGKETGRTLGQAALLWLLAEPTVCSTLPNIYNEDQLKEFAAAPEKNPITPEELERIDQLWGDNFGVKGEEPRYKGTMARQAA